MPGVTAVHDLPYLTWLGSRAYASNVDTSWSFRNPERAYPYVDGEAHENTGRKSLQVTATLQFLNTIEPGMFPGKWRNFRNLLLLGQSGTLRHPDIGNFHARVVNVSYPITPGTSSGVEVTVAWSESIKNADEPTKIVAGASDAAASAAAIDNAMQILDIDYPDGMADGTTFASSVNALFSLGAEYTHQLAGAINQVTGFADQVFRGIQLIGSAQIYLPATERNSIVYDPNRHILEAALNSLRLQLQETLDVAKKSGGLTKTHVVQHDASLASLSIQLEADISDLVRLNPETVKAPLVRKGTKLLYRVEA